ncbi:XapX domain-containing protein [Natronomonas sp. F2-12]|uniref:XapX domain-containing protein n=1 Tax=Natronomonas aquatica TaxID=2841590 RepID=A0A9R1D4D6_9EURY|nr:XapX domain-containing protein [Natronomonas aquatica]MCQ4333254.1 XapX domain-containing protein [Natronomonas aquatica]
MVSPTVGVPITAPPPITGVLGIAGIYLRFGTVEYLGIGFDPLSALGL